MQQFSAGQVWTYKTRDDESASRIVVCLVETDPKLGPVVHIHVNGLRVRNNHASGGFSDSIGHMPYSADALRQSVLLLESNLATLPSFEEGHEDWRSAVDSRNAGVWNIPVADAITAMESVMNQ